MRQPITLRPVRTLRTVSSASTRRRRNPIERDSDWRSDARHDPKRVVLGTSPSARRPGGRDATSQAVEALLFLAKEPLTAKRLAQAADLENGPAVRAVIRGLNRLYDREGRSFRIEAVGGGYRLLTRGRFASWLRRMNLMPRPVALSVPMQETLAVIAWRQPVPRSEIEAIRGVNCGEIMRQLLERDLVRIVGRSDDLGRPYLYGTTRRFLLLYGLRSLSDLPRIEIYGPVRHPVESDDQETSEVRASS